MRRILVIDDDAESRDTVRELVWSLQFQTIEASDGLSGTEAAARERPDLIILDLNMPGIDGIEVCRRLKAHVLTAPIPIIMVTAIADSESCVRGLDAGADDYLCKPFRQKELAARINACLRRGHLPGTGAEVIQVGNLEIFLRTMAVKVAGTEIHFTPREFELLVYFATHEGETLSRKKLLSEVWPDTAVGERTSDTHVTYLRKKLKGCTHGIETVYGFGFAFKRDPHPS